MQGVGTNNTANTAVYEWKLWADKAGKKISKPTEYIAEGVKLPISLGYGDIVLGWSSSHKWSLCLKLLPFDELPRQGQCYTQIQTEYYVPVPHDKDRHDDLKPPQDHPPQGKSSPLDPVDLEHLEVYSLASDYPESCRAWKCHKLSSKLMSLSFVDTLTSTNKPMMTFSEFVESEKGALVSSTNVEPDNINSALSSFTSSCDQYQKITDVMQEAKSTMKSLQRYIHSRLRWVATFELMSTPTDQSQIISVKIPSLTRDGGGMNHIVTREDTLLQYAGSTLYNAIKFPGDDSKESVLVHRPYIKCDADELFQSFQDYCKNSKGVEVSDIGMAQIEQRMADIFVTKLIEDPDLYAILNILGDFKKYFNDGNAVVQFLEHVRADRKFKCVDLSDTGVDPASIMELLDHMRLIRLFRHGLCSDPGLILSRCSNPIKMKAALEVFQIIPVLY